MAKMIIDIPDNMQEMCKWHKEGICDLTNIEVYILAEAVINGIVLPKGHGRLIDADNMKRIDAIQRGDFNSIESIGAWIDIMPTIIKADKEESGDKE